MSINKTNMQNSKSIPTLKKNPLPKRIIKSHVRSYNVPSSPLRNQCIEWLYKGQQKLHFSRSSLFIAFGMLDKLLVKGLKLSETNYQLVAALLLLISTKFNQVYPASIKNLNALCKDEYSVRQFIEAEGVILQNLDFTVILEPIYEELLELESLYEGKQGKNVKELIKMAVMNPNQTFKFGSTSLIQAVQSLSFEGRLFEINANNSDQDQQIQFIRSQFTRLKSASLKKLVDPIQG